MAVTLPLPHGPCVRVRRIFRLLDQLRGANLVRVVVVVLAMTLISHWLACIW